MRCAARSSRAITRAPAMPATTICSRIPRVDVVMIGLPHFLHTEVTLAACAARKHIFLEKPMAMTVADCDAIIAAAEEAGVKLLVAHTEHFVPAGLAAYGN